MGGRGGRHREALIIYINILGDLEMARQYCAREKSAGRSEVYQHLVELLVSPIESSQLPGGAKLSGHLKLPDMETAVSVLEQHWRDVDISRVIASLPPSPYTSCPPVSLLPYRARWLPATRPSWPELS